MENETGRKLSIVLGIHHVTLLVTDLERSAVFYETGLGLVRKQRPPFTSEGIWYALGMQEVHLLKKDRAAAHNDAHPAFEVSDMETAIANCQAAGGTLDQGAFVREHDDSLSAFVRDPDGNLIELCFHDDLRIFSDAPEYDPAE